jgi:hypothetical protein
MGWGEYFRVDAEANCVDSQTLEGQASCCGVNLAFAGFWGWGGRFSRILRSHARSQRGSSVLSAVHPFSVVAVLRMQS